MIRHLSRVASSLVRERLKRVTRSPRWRAVERHWLRANPSCAACGGLARLQVHHVEPFHERPELELDAGNLITLCMGPEECHLLVGHLGSWKLSNPHVRAYAAALLRRWR